MSTMHYNTFSFSILSVDISPCAVLLMFCLK